MEEWFNAAPGWQGAKSVAEYEKTRELEPEDGWGRQANEHKSYNNISYVFEHFMPAP